VLEWGNEGMRECGTASGRFGVPGPFGIQTLPLAYFNDGTRILNGDAAERAGSSYWPF